MNRSDVKWKSDFQERGNDTYIDKYKRLSFLKTHMAVYIVILWGWQKAATDFPLGCDGINCFSQFLPDKYNHELWQQCKRQPKENFERRKEEGKLVNKWKNILCS